MDPKLLQQKVLTRFSASESGVRHMLGSIRFSKPQKSALANFKHRTLNERIMRDMAIHAVDINPYTPVRT
ncbi:MAG: hypothetical protein ACTSUE_22790 [Promethearchaeota archaeon]